MEDALKEKIINVIESFDIDFVVGSALLTLLSAEYTDNPIEMYNSAITLLSRRAKLLQNRKDNNVPYKKKELI